MMTELLRLARSLRREFDTPMQRLAHRLRVGLAVALLILALSSLR